MENAKEKKLHINAGVLDATSLSAETLDAYESISANVGLLIVTPESSALLAQAVAHINAGRTLSITTSADINLVMHNGSFVLTADSKAQGEADGLMVNGSLRLEPGCEEALRSYKAIICNGSVVLPENLRGLLGLIQQNGPVQSYPAGAEYVDGKLEINARFARAVSENTLYWTFGKAFLADARVDAAALLEKGVSIHAGRAYVSDDIPDGEMLFDAKTDVRQIPTGYALVCDLEDNELTIDEWTAEIYGKRLFLLGNVVANKTAAKGLEAIEAIIVEGEARVHESLLPLWRQKCRQMTRLKLLDDSHAISDKEEIIVSEALLRGCEKGLHISDCATVCIAPEVASELLAEKLLEIRDVARCVCTEEQQAILQLVSDDVIFAREKGVPNEDEDEDVVRINAGTYKL